MKTNLMIAFVLLTLLLAACGGGAPAASLTGTAWRLTQLNGQPIVENTTPTLTFDADGQAGGQGSCNGFGGSYETENEKLTFGPLRSTLMACMETGVMEQEAAYFEALAKTTSYSVAGERLTLFDENGVILAEFVKE